MKLRKCLLWQTQRPSIGITSRAWNVDTIRDGLSGHLRGNAASDGSRYTPLTVFLDAKKNTKEKKENSSKDFTVSIGKFAEPWMLHSKLGDNIYRYTGIPGLYEHFYFEELREDFYRAWLVHIYACMVFFTFFQISSLDCPIYPIISLLIDSFNQWHFVFLFQIFYINTCTYNISLKKQLQSL